MASPVPTWLASIQSAPLGDPNKLMFSPVNIQQEDIFKNNHLQDVKDGINTKSLISNDTMVGRTCNDSQSVEKKKYSKRVFIVGDSIIKQLNGYEIVGKTGDYNVYVRPSHGAKVRCIVDHINSVRRDKPDHIIVNVGNNEIPSDKNA